MGMALKKRDIAVGDAGGSVNVSAGKWGSAFPSLWEFLTSAKYPDGSSRILGSLSIWVDVGCIKACLNDRDQGLVAFATADSPEGLWSALEKGLRDDTLDWKRGSQPPQKKKK
ncbi:MAG: hypothetical protein [Circular genetic element sp.]|nr:MAG: hypothetical protein [Circular genetic element sp.]